MSRFAALQTLRARWKALAPREQNLLIVAAAIVGLALLWWVALAPALTTLRNTPARHASLDAQLQAMQALQAEALQLQAAPRANPSDAVQALQTAVAQRLSGVAQISTAGDRATVTLKGAPAAALAQWLAEARSNARAVPIQAQLTRSAATDANAGTARWDGTLVMALPAN